MLVSDVGLLEARDLRAGYVPAVDILHGVSIQVGVGEIVTIIGPNGAGKSTLLSVILGFLQPHDGQVTFDGDEVTGARPHELARRGVGFVPQTDNVFPTLTVRENMEMGGYRCTSSELDERIGQLEERFPLLAERRGERAGSLSGGQRQLLAMGRALVSSPRLLCLDEPSAGLAPIFVERIFEAIAQLRDDDVTVLMVEQNARMALSISDRGYVLDMGRNAHEGTGPGLLEDDRVVELYLGGGQRDEGAPEDPFAP